DDDHARIRCFIANGGGSLVLRTVITSTRDFVALELDDDVTVADLRARALLGYSAADNELRVVLLEGQCVCRDVILIAIRIVHLHMGDPVSLGHRLLSKVVRWPEP